MLILFTLPTESANGVRILGFNDRFALRAFLFYGLAWLGAAAIEELIFRGYLLQALSIALGNWLALGISSILFALAHLGETITFTAIPASNLLPFVGTVLFSVLLGVGYLRSGTLWLPIGLHFAVNFTLAHILSAPLQVKFPNGILRIDPHSQLLAAQWPLVPLPPGLIEILLTVVVYLAAMGLLLLWPFKPSSHRGPTSNSSHQTRLQ